MINDNMRSKLRQLARRLEEIDGMLADPACASDMSKFRALTKERADIEPVVKKHLELESVDMDISTAQGMLEDPEMKAFAQEEILEAQKKLGPLSLSQGPLRFRSRETPNKKALTEISVRAFCFFLELVKGLEPITCRLQISCSTD